MSQLSLFPEEYTPIETRKRSSKCFNKDVESHADKDDYAEVGDYKTDSRPRKVRRLRDLGIYGREADFYRSICMATHMAPQSIKAVIDALAEYVSVAIAEGRDIKIPGLCTVSTKIVRERITQLANRRNGEIVKRLVPAHRKVKFRPANELLKRANVRKMPNTMECK